MTELEKVRKKCYARLLERDLQKVIAALAKIKAILDDDKDLRHDCAEEIAKQLHRAREIKYIVDHLSEGDRRQLMCIMFMDLVMEYQQRPRPR